MSTSFIPASRNRLRRGYTIALVSALILSTTAIFIRYLTQVYGLPAIILAFWRDLIVSLSLLLGLAVLHPTLLKLPRQHIGYLLIFGFLLAVFNSLWTLSVAINGAAVATVLAYCSAAFTTLLGWWFFKEFLHWAKLVAVVLSLGGCMLVAGALDPASWRLNLLGSLVGILSGLLWASYSLLGRSASQSLDYSLLHLYFRHRISVDFQPPSWGFHPRFRRFSRRFVLAWKCLVGLVGVILSGSRSHFGWFRVVQCCSHQPARQCRQSHHHLRTRLHRSHRFHRSWRESHWHSNHWFPIDPGRGHPVAPL
jgi:drug/metabolite transporter (DMT)-like permease